MIEISVIIPTYKPKGYLWQCLESILIQSLSASRYEVIIVVNGCKDPYLEKIQEYIKVHNALNVRVYQTDVPSVSNARNIGIASAKGRFISFLDDDDFVSGNYLESFLDQSPDDNTIVESNVLDFTDNINNTFDDYLGKAFEKCYNKKNPSLFFARSFMSSSCCKIIPKKSIGARRFDSNYRKGEDSLFMATISDAIKKIKTTDKSSYYYRRVRPASASRKKEPLASKLGNSLKLIGSYTSLYLSNCKNYNLAFFLSRIVATVLNAMK